jgi:hypothetical protein
MCAIYWLECIYKHCFSCARGVLDFYDIYFFNFLGSLTGTALTLHCINENPSLQMKKGK